MSSGVLRLGVRDPFRENRDMKAIGAAKPLAASRGSRGGWDGAGTLFLLRPPPTVEPKLKEAGVGLAERTVPVLGPGKRRRGAEPGLCIRLCLSVCLLYDGGGKNSRLTT